MTCTEFRNQCLTKASDSTLETRKPMYAHARACPQCQEWVASLLGQHANPDHRRRGREMYLQDKENMK